ncbi:membrane protein [Brevibacillus reuszeri]|uniref:Membrane protein n=1 Tax=Brevibacillus reuszeri TaxID=54915 RepID=A0ABQ0TXI7_9BACL|nr:YitT family protein [Brevibacillus reuszeri]MED1855902.1 YitT family protein [Brevibacillus reuszeri]GED72132.1 membrane protein [Brevibacillus reuszeri]
MNWLYKCLAIFTGSMLVAVGVNLFLVPHRLMDGGMIGIGLLATYYMQLPPGMVMIFVSLPMYLIVFFFDRRLFYHSFHGMLISSFFIDVMSDLRQWNLLSTSSSAVTGGVMIGMGVGLMLAYETNTGGTDLLAQFFARRFNIPVALLILAIDGLIVALSLRTIGIERTIFSLITIVAVAATTHMFSGISKKRLPYSVIGPLGSVKSTQIRQEGRGWRLLWRK